VGSCALLTKLSCSQLVSWTVLQIPKRYNCLELGYIIKNTHTRIMHPICFWCVCNTPDVLQCCVALGALQVWSPKIEQRLIDSKIISRSNCCLYLQTKRILLVLVRRIVKSLRNAVQCVTVPCITDTSCYSWYVIHRQSGRVQSQLSDTVQVRDHVVS
jgi:hypothetical protein